MLFIGYAHFCNQDRSVLCVLTLGRVSYRDLIQRRHEVYKEIDAMAVLVSMASMNVDVLMAEVLAKKKHVNMRIDSTPEGHRMLSDALRYTSDGDVSMEVKTRLRVAQRLKVIRDGIDLELVSYQQGWDRFPITQLEKDSVLQKFILNKLNYFSSTIPSLVESEFSGTDMEAEIHQVVVEELRELLLEINTPKMF